MGRGAGVGPPPASAGPRTVTVSSHDWRSTFTRLALKCRQVLRRGQSLRVRCQPPMALGAFTPSYFLFPGSVIPRVHFWAGFCQAMCPWQVMEPLRPLGSSPTEGQRPSSCHCTYCCKRVSHLGLLLALSQDTRPREKIRDSGIRQNHIWFQRHSSPAL